jgi:hypothetical protein
MCIKLNKVGKQEVGIWLVQKRNPQYGVPIVTFFSATIDVRDLIFGHKLHIGTHIMGSVLDPSDSYFLFADFVDFYTHWLVTKYQISVINSCWEKCDEKCAYMFNVYKDQLSRQTGSRNLIGPKTLHAIWYTYMMLVTKFLPPYRGKRFWTHQIPTSCLPT